MTTSFSQSAPKNAAFVVYINGIETPAKSVSLRYGVWQIPECQVQMVPDPVLTRLGYEDRVQLQVFYLDDTPVDPSVKPAFRLFFDGEITGWGYQLTSQGRSITFTAINQIAIFTQLFVQFLTTFDDLVGHATLAGQGADDQGVVTSEIVFPFSLFKQGILPPGTTKGTGAASSATQTALTQDNASIVRPFDFLYNIVKNMIGSLVPPAQRTIPAANFFTRWDRLTNFHNRFVASPFFDEAKDNKNVFPVLKAIQSASAVDTIARNLMPMVQNKGSLYDMIQVVYQTVLMEVAMIPSMPLVKVDLATNLVQPTDASDHRLVQGTREILSLSDTAATHLIVTGQVAALPSDSRAKSPRRIPSYFPKPQLLFGIPPSCNVVFPSQLKTLAYEENYATQPTRIYFNDETLIKLFKIPRNGFGQTIHNALTIAYPPEADAVLQQKKTSGSRLNGKDFLLYPEEFFKGPVLDRRNVPPWLFFLKKNELDNGQPKGTTTDNQPAGADPPAKTAQPTVTRPTAPSGSGVTPPPSTGQVAERVDSAPSAPSGQVSSDVLAALEGAEDVYHLYAKYEYFRDRYARRSGSAQLAWNPYVVPGFPAMIFDHRSSRVDIACYVTTVQQYMSADGHRSTTLSFMYGRQIQEMFDLMAQQFALGDASAGSGPAEPIRDIRKIIQSFTQAEQYYQRLFYGATSQFGKDASFDFRKIIGYASSTPNGAPVNIFVDGPEESAQDDVSQASATLSDLVQQQVSLTTQIASLAAQIETNQKLVDELAKNVSPTPEDLQQIHEASAAIQAAKIAIPALQLSLSVVNQGIQRTQSIITESAQFTKTTQVTHNLVGDREIVPLPQSQAMFDSYDAAMRYAWRPICTLDEYVVFYDSVGEGVVPAAGNPQSLGAPYYARIRRLKPATSDKLPVPGADGLGVAPTATAPQTAAQQGAVDPQTGKAAQPPASVQQAPGLSSSTFPDTRSTWDDALLAYRQNVRVVKVPRT